MPCPFAPRLATYVFQVSTTINLWKRLGFSFFHVSHENFFPCIFLQSIALPGSVLCQVNNPCCWCLDAPTQVDFSWDHSEVKRRVYQCEEIGRKLHKASYPSHLPSTLSRSTESIFSQKTGMFGLKDVLSRGRLVKHSHDLFLTVYSVLPGL